MKKNLFLAALAFVAMASCTNDEFVGENTSPTPSNTNGTISFGMSTPAITRAKETGATAAAKLNNNFVVFGYKTVSSTSSTVFDNYQVNWVTNTAGSTESNSADWEYVSYTSKASTPVTQSIKYWDFNASTYDFFAYSLGIGDGETTPTYATASVMTNSTYTLTGNQAQLGACYISKKKHMSSLSSSTTEVDLEFVSFLSKIQLKFFEIIPGYSVKDVKFYTDASTKSTGDASGDGLAPALYSTSTMPTGGTYTITFDDAYEPVVTLTSASSTATTVLFPAAVTTPSISWLDNYAGKEYQEADASVYLGRTSSAATASKQITVLPNSTGAALTLKMDYTLVSRDGTGETIQVTGATATIPADYTKWKPNYAYTYIFKISDNTNGQIGSETGLYPITLDAEVVTDVAGNQTTITTVATPSITTYQSGAIANEYSAGNIYVTVGEGTTALTVGTNANLYKATIEAGAAQGLDGSGNVAITEAMVDNALSNGSQNPTGTWTVTDANGKKLTVTAVATDAADKLTGGLTAIPAADAPGGKELSIKCASFTAANNTVYVFEYIDSSDSKKYYKVIKVGTPVAVNP